MLWRKEKNVEESRVVGIPREWASAVRFEKVRMGFIQRTSGAEQWGVSPVARCREGQGTKALRFTEHPRSWCGWSRASEVHGGGKGNPDGATGWGWGSYPAS